MSKSTLHFLVLYGVLTITLVYLASVLFQNPVQKSVKHIPSGDNKSLFWDIYPELVIPNLGKKIDSGIGLKDLNNEHVSIERVLKSGSFLVFRYSRYDCNLCVDQLLEKLHVFFKGSESRVCLMIDGMTEREFKIKYGSKGIKFPVFFLDNNLGLSLENKNLPFLFVLSPDFRADKIFVPFKEFPRQTDAYLKNIKAIFGD